MTSGTERSVALDRIRTRQCGMTLPGFLLLVVLIGAVGFAGLRIVPMYIKHYTLATVLNELHNELEYQNASAATIRTALNKHLIVEGIDLPRDDVKISPVPDGYQVRIQHESQAHYLADVWLVVKFDKTVQIHR